MIGSHDAGTIAFLASGFASHVYSSLGLARRLQALGFAVEYWSEPHAKRLVVTKGFTHRDLGSVWSCYEPLAPLAWLRSLRTRGPAGDPQRTSRQKSLAGGLAEFERSLDDQLTRCRPRLVIVDTLAAAYVPLLRHRGLKCILLHDKPAPIADALVPPPTSALVPSDSAGGRGRVRLHWARERATCAIRAFANDCLGLVGVYTPEQLICSVQQRIGNGSANAIRRRVSYDLHDPSIEEWVLGAPESDFPRARPLPRTVRFVGPCVDLDRLNERGTVARDPRAKFLIYVSMGTMLPHWKADLRLLDRVVEAFRPVGDVQLVISTGNVHACTVLRRCGSRAQVFPYLPQLSLLRAADLAITHAGAGAYRECISTHTPMLAYPREYDQQGNAARIVYHGMGLRGSRRFDSSASIRRKALRILEDPKYVQAARALDEKLRKSESHLLSQALHAALCG